MALKEINIADLVKVHTVETIQSSSYDVLKRALIDRKPLAAVIDAIDTNLAAATQKDKNANQHLATEAACSAQIREDNLSAADDANEVVSDAELKKELNRKSPQLASQLAHCSSELNTIERLLETQEALLRGSRASKANLENQLATIRQERQEIHRRYPPIQVTHTHEHGHPQNTHQHSHPAGPVASIAYSQQDSWEVSRLAGLESGLMLQMPSLDMQINTQNVLTLETRAKVSQIRDDKNQKESALSKVTYQLTTGLPGREWSRKQREDERLARKNARLGEDPQLKQLSDVNRRNLNSNITDYNYRLDNTRNTLMNAAKDSSYTVFMEQLKLKLDNPAGLAISQPEVEALKQTSELFNEYKKLEQEDTRLSNNCTRAKTNLNNLRNELKREEEALAHYTDSNPALTKKNGELAAKNTELSELAKSNRNTATIQFAFFGTNTGIALIACAVIVLMSLNPLFFIAPGVFGLAALGTLIAAIVFKYKESSNSQQIETNTATISANTKQVAGQERVMDVLSNRTIPSLKEKISQSESHLRGSENELSSHREKMRLQMGKVEGVTPVQQSASSVFVPIAVPPAGPGVTPILAATTTEHGEPTTSYSMS